jgi:hypothetical protein
MDRPTYVEASKLASGVSFRVVDVQYGVLSSPKKFAKGGSALWSVSVVPIKVVPIKIPISATPHEYLFSSHVSLSWLHLSAGARFPKVLLLERLRLPARSI